MVDIDKLLHRVKCAIDGMEKVLFFDDLRQKSCDLDVVDVSCEIHEGLQLLEDTKVAILRLREHENEGGRQMKCGHPEQALYAGDDGKGYCRWCKELEEWN